MDWVGSWLRPMCQLVVTSVVLMVALVVGLVLHVGWIVVVFVLGVVVMVVDNGLVYIVVVELVGFVWSGWVLGVQNMVQNVAVVATVLLLVSVIGDVCYVLGFAVVMMFPFVVIGTMLVRAEW